MTTIERGVALMIGFSAWLGVLWRWRAIIGAALVGFALTGCSVLRIGYGQAPTLAGWWIDSYADLDSAQSTRLREGIDQWFDWHRRTEMPLYAQLLARAQREVMEPTLTPAALCAWRDEAQRRADAATEQAVPALAALVATLTPAQVRHIERQLAKKGEEMRADFAHPDRAERAQASFKRTLERYENLYGRLDEAQRAKLGQMLAASTFDPERWLAERERRNRDLVATLNSVVNASNVDAGVRRRQAESAVRLLAERAQRSPRADYRAYQERLSLDNCALAAVMHNSMSAAQRQQARAKLKGWEDDVRWIANNGGAAATAPALNGNHSR
jgi:Family of unknown function (DUF6279)